MTLFKKGQGDQGGSAAKAPVFRPIDRNGLLGLLDQVVNGGQSGVLELHEPRGNWVYAFQAGALTHASGGRVRGARQAFDLLWEFQSGEFMFAAGPIPGRTATGMAGAAGAILGSRWVPAAARLSAATRLPAAAWLPSLSGRAGGPVSAPGLPAGSRCDGAAGRTPTPTGLPSISG